MYGYVRPLKAELKVREFEAYQGVYCGLCHCLAQRCGSAARFVVNYDFTFLAMLLEEGQTADFAPRGCPVRPLRKRAVLKQTPALERAADLSVILAHWKLRDDLRDEGPGKTAGAAVALAALHRAYSKAKAAQPEFAAACEQYMQGLHTLEQESCASVDRAADCFATLLASLAMTEKAEARKRVLRELFYHIGRVVYVLDAVDDLEKDMKKKNYNPLVYRYGLTAPQLPEPAVESLRLSLSHSMSAMSGAYSLLPENAFRPITENILYLGIPSAIKRLLGQSPETKCTTEEIRNA